MYKIIFLILLINISYADEVWHSTYGTVIYQDEIRDIAIWSYNWEDSKNYIYIHGLAGVYENRGSYSGVWVQPNSEQRCKQYIVLHTGEKSHYWGKINLTFIDPNFPSHWQASWNYCEKEPDPNLGLWEASPITSETLTTCDIGDKPIWSQMDAEQQCPKRCARLGGSWTGHWVTTIQGQASVCNCKDIDKMYCYQ